MVASTAEPRLSTVGASAAEPLLSTVGAAALAAAAAPDARPIVDTVLGVADGARALSGSSPGSSRAAATAKPSKSSGAGYAKTASAAKSSSGSKATGPLAFLKDARLSVEEKLIRLLAYLNDRWEKDLQKKMEEMAGGQATSAPRSSGTSSTSSRKKSPLGTMGAAAELAKRFFPQAGLAIDALKNPAVRAVVAKIGGPVLAAGASALGFPALAPALLKYGPAAIDVAAGVASAFADQVGGDASSPTAARSAASAGSASGGAMSDRQLQVKAMEIQRIMDQQKEMFSLVSNIVRSGHEARMAVIQNVR